MTDPADSERLVLVVDDDPEAVRLIERVLSSEGYAVTAALGGEEGLEAHERLRPRLVLLDVEMPGMNGYAVAEQLQLGPAPSTPIVFVTARGEAESRSQALSLGAVGYLVKPFQRERLLEVVAEHIDDVERWRRLADGSVRLPEAVTPSDFDRFKQMLVARSGAEGDERAALAGASPDALYATSASAGIAAIDVAELLADFLDLEVVSALDPASVDLSAVPAAFGEKNLVVMLVTEDGSAVFAVSNPFDWHLLDVLEGLRSPDGRLRLVITEPEGIRSLFRLSKDREEGEEAGLEGGTINLPTGRATLRARAGKSEDRFAVSLKDVQEQPVVFIANSLILEVMREGASDIHLEPKEDTMHVRFRIDGDMRDVLKLNSRTGVKLVSRLKALGGLDIAERRKPQDGSLEVNAGPRKLKLRLATSSGPFGESMVIRVLDSTQAPTRLEDLGMTTEQAVALYGYAGRTQGLILIVGPTGSGKTTTIYSVLSAVDTELRSLMSVEDPVEYLIPRANQQQVNVKAGVSFDSLLKSSVRQDPDILFLGEVRDGFSAKTAVDFASTGHLTITTLHTSNATSAIFRLERLGVERSMMVEALLCVVAQRLVKRLCPECRQVVDITDDERAMLAPFTEDVPEKVARPAGCPQCRDGYAGREGVYEVLDFDEQMAGWIREGVSIKEIRMRLWDQGAYLVHRHAVQKVRELTISVADAYANVLVEDEGLAREREAYPVAQPAAPAAPGRQPAPPPPTDDGEPLIGATEVERGGGDLMIGAGTAPRRVLVAEDDDSTRVLLERVLSDAGYEVTAVGDGAGALEAITTGGFDLVLSDLNMPELDGLALLERVRERGIGTPVLMLTGSTEGADEAEALESGVSDFVHKPIRRDVLLLRVRRALGG